MDEGVDQSQANHDLGALSTWDLKNYCVTITTLYYYPEVIRKPYFLCFFSVLRVKVFKDTDLVATLLLLFQQALKQIFYIDSRWNK